jgi:hypothetical protein
MSRHVTHSITTKRAYSPTPNWTQNYKPTTIHLVLVYWYQDMTSISAKTTNTLFEKGDDDTKRARLKLTSSYLNHHKALQQVHSNMQESIYLNNNTMFFQLLTQIIRNWTLSEDTGWLWLVCKAFHLTPDRVTRDKQLYQFCPMSLLETMTPQTERELCLNSSNKWPWEWESVKLTQSCCSYSG